MYEKFLMDLTLAMLKPAANFSLFCLYSYYSIQLIELRSYNLVLGHSDELLPLEGNISRGLWKESCWDIIREV